MEESSHPSSHADGLNPDIDCIAEAHTWPAQSSLYKSLGNDKDGMCAILYVRCIVLTGRAGAVFCVFWNCQGIYLCVQLLSLKQMSLGAQ